MGDTGSLKRDAKRKSSRGSKINRFVSLFEIPRPSKTKGVQRTNSLPASKRPSVASIEEDKDSSRTGSLPKYPTTHGRVRQIKEEIEQKARHKDAVVAPKKKRTKAQKPNLDQESWESDKQKIMENLSKLQELIADVTIDIQQSDTELEITHSQVPEDDNSEEVFEDAEEFSDREVIRDKCNDENSECNRFSSETLKEEFEDTNEISFTSYHALVRVPRWEDYENVDDPTTPTELDPANITSRAEISVENHQVEEADAEETFDSSKSTKTDEDDDDEPVPDNSQVDSIAWWKHKSFVQINNIEKPVSTTNEIDAQPEEACPTNEIEASINKIESIQPEEVSPANENDVSPKASWPEETSPILGGRFIKNNRSRRNRRNDRRRTGILQRPHTVMDLAKHFEGFKEAAESGETETYRRSFIDEMDKELENMKNDGFREDFHLSMENLTLLDVDDEDQDGFFNFKAQDGDLFQTIIILPNSSNEENEYENVATTQDPDDFYGETLFSEDLENGLYYLEAYNADRKELIKCSVQIDRQSVDLSSFDEMNKGKSKWNVLANDDRTLVLFEDAPSDSKSGTDSKRNTIYSTTSGESYEDDERDVESLYNYSAARRETYCDNKGVVRIERVAPYPEKPENPEEYVETTNNYYYSGREENAMEDEENYYESIRLEHEIMFSVPQVKKDTLQYILEEIKSTERKYIADMKKLLREYKTFLEERCPEKVDVVFANMDQIYEEQLEFLQALEHSNMDVKEVVQAFIDFEELFRLYPRYFRNSLKATAAVKELGFLIKEKQERMNDKLDLSAYLLTPLQRLGKYKLFLENIIKQLEKEDKSTGAAQMALEIVKKYMSKGNDAVAIASILYSPLHTKDYGSFITREKFLLIKPKRLELMVFLFDGAVVFTTEDPKNMEQFVYHQSIKTNDLRIATFDDTTIHLTDYTKIRKRNSSKYTYVLEAKTEKLKASWKQQIEDILWKQMRKIKENTLKEYQSGNNRTPRTPMRSREQRSKSTGSSIFYIE